MTTNQFPLYQPHQTLALEEPQDPRPVTGELWPAPRTYAQVGSSWVPQAPVASSAGGVDRVLATTAHASGLFAFLLGPAAIRMIAPKGSRAHREAAKAFNFQLQSLVMLVVAAVVFGGVLGAGWVVDLGALVWLGLTGYHAVKAWRGDDWRNPVVRDRFRVMDEAGR